MICPKCSNPIEEDTVFCGNCGTQVAPVYARGATVVESTEKIGPDRVQAHPSIPPMSPPPAHFSPATAQPGRMDDLQSAPTVFTPAPPSSPLAPTSRRLNMRRAI